MKSRIRSRWHRPNEKPLENDASPAPIAPIGEIDSSNPSALTDDLSNYKPDRKVGSKHRDSLHSNDRRNDKGKSGNRRPKPRNNNRRGESQREKQIDGEGEAKKTSNHPKRRPRKRNNNNHKKGSETSAKNKAKRSSNPTSPANKASQKGTGIKGFLGKLFG